MNTYTAKKTDLPLSVNDSRWALAAPASLDFRWAEGCPSPYTTTFRILHGDGGLSVRIETNEWPLRAVHTACNEEICEDSCVEFFFTPNEGEKTYMNIEINPLGVSHIGLGDGRHGRRLLDIAGEGVLIETHITFREGWAASVFLPYAFLNKHFASVGDRWRMNCYKCGDLTPIEHYQTWNPVGVPAPDYHRPEFFGSLVLSDEKA